MKVDQVLLHVMPGKGQGQPLEQLLLDGVERAD
jgi:hypothetical protein